MAGESRIRNLIGESFDMNRTEMAEMSRPLRPGENGAPGQTPTRYILELVANGTRYAFINDIYRDAIAREYLIQAFENYFEGVVIMVPMNHAPNVPQAVIYYTVSNAFYQAMLQNWQARHAHDDVVELKKDIGRNHHYGFA